MDPQQNNQVPLQVTKKCNHLPIIIILVLLLIGACGFGGYEFWQGMQKDTEIIELKDNAKGKDIEIAELKEEINDKPNAEVIPDTTKDGNAISISEAEEILKKYIGKDSTTSTMGFNVYYNTYKSDFDKQQKAFLTYKSLEGSEKNNKVDCEEEYKERYMCTGWSISYKTMSEEYESLFGDYDQIEKKDYTFADFYHLSYDAKLDAYREYVFPGGGGGSSALGHKVVSVEKEGDDMVVSLVYVLLSDTIEIDCEYANTVCSVPQASTDGKNYYSGDSVWDYSKAVLDGVTLYKFTLSPYNGTYVLTDVTKL